MNEQELKIILQGAIDGKVIQARKDNLVPSWTDVEQRGIVSIFKFITPNLFGYEFRVKPDVKVFKYKTRPCMYHEVLLKTNTFNVWCSNSGITQEQYARDTEFSKDFRWLAPTTEHEVVYE